MVTIRLTNTKTRRKEDFRPIDASNVRMYVCGPTVYDRAHLGNARPVIVFDVLNRLLRHVYGTGHVTYVRNFTDVDDKINAEALRRQKAGSPGTLEDLIHERTEETIAWYHADMDALGAMRPDNEPRATDYIEEMKDMISVLIERGHAYVVRDPTNNPPKEYVIFDQESRNAGHSLFDVTSFENYGKFAGRSLEDMIAGARVEVAPYKRNAADFVLWKPSSDDEPGWDSPWGRGRPGWHIECSAMAQKLLGDTFDIHGGGLDLQFPHHENEIAQSCCALATPDDPLGEQKFAHYWLHNEMLQVEGKKMSKSLGNFFTVRDLLEQGVPGEVIRFVFLMTHYRKPMDWTKEKASDARHTLKAWFRGTDGVTAASDVPSDVVELLSNDLNSAGAIAEMHSLANRDEWASLKAAMRLIGLPDAEEVGWFREEMNTASFNNFPDYGPLWNLLKEWQNLRNAKNYGAADALKAKIEACGLKLSVSIAGPEVTKTDYFDPAKLEALQ